MRARRNAVAQAPICGQQIGQMGTSKVADEEKFQKFKKETFWASDAGGRVFQSVKRQREYLGYRSGTPELTGPESSLPILIGAAMIAAASPERPKR